MYEVFKYLHILGATILFGTGLGIAFFLFSAVRSKRLEKITGVAEIVVIADYVFTLTAAILQPLTGLTLMWLLDLSLSELWIWMSLLLYVVIGLCWVPVVFIQIEMRDISRKAFADNTELNARFYQLYRRWFLLGWPAFISMLTIFWLMLTKPA